MTLYVNPEIGNDNAMGSSVAPLRTLTKAIKRVIGETLIQLTPGTYSTASGEKFPLLVPRGVVILGNESNQGKEIVLRGSGSYQSSSFGEQQVLLLLEDEAQLRGVTVTNPAKKGTGVWLESSSPLLSRNTFANCGREGVFAAGKSKPIIQDNIFWRNAATGIFLVRHAKGEVRRNLFQETGYGIAITDASAPLLTENRMLSNRIGIYLSRQARPVLRRNLVEKSRDGGPSARTSGGLVITGEALPDFGHVQDPAGNVFRDNEPLDLRQDTGSEIISVGNELNPAKVQGKVSFLASQVTSFPPGPSKFADISGHWAEAFITRLVELGIISGFPDGTFRPNAKLTRAEYAVLIANSFNLPRKVAAGTWLRDIPPNFWALSAIEKAAAMGFIVGFPDGTFRPQRNLTRLQALLSLVNGLGLTGNHPNLLLTYSDRAEIPSYGAQEIGVATKWQLVVNYPQPHRLEPMRDITRAEVAAFLHQALVATGRVEVINSPYIVNVTAQAESTSFIDVGQHWAGDMIHRLADLNLVSGFSDGSFKPDALLNRAQYAALIVKIFDPAPIRPARQFLDLAPDFWALEAIQRAYRAGFLSGFPDQTFHPEQNLRRLHLILSLAAGLALPAANQNALDYYEDSYTIPTYAQGAVAAATEARIVVNYPTPTQLEESRLATRAEAGAMAYQGLVFQGRVSESDSPYIVGVALT